MPVTIKIDTERRLTITTGEGVVTDEDFVEARALLLADPKFDPSFDRIWDFHLVTEAHVTEQIVARLVAESPASSKPICRAVVMSKQTAPMKAILDFVNRTRQASRRIAAFPDLTSAEKWVIAARGDLPPDRWPIKIDI